MNKVRWDSMVVVLVVLWGCAPDRPAVGVAALGGRTADAAARPDASAALAVDGEGADEEPWRSPALREASTIALEDAAALAESSRLAEIEFGWSRRGFVTSMTSQAALSLRSEGSPGELATAFVAAHRGLLGLSTEDVAALEIIREAPSTLRGRTVVRFRQVHRGHDVAGSVLQLHVTDGAIRYVLAHVAPSVALEEATDEIRVDAAQARSTARAARDAPANLTYFDSELRGEVPDRPRLAWRVDDTLRSTYVDAETGVLLAEEEPIDSDMHREIMRCPTCDKIEEILPDLAAVTPLRFDDVCHYPSTPPPPLCSPSTPGRLCNLGGYSCTTTGSPYNVCTGLNSDCVNSVIETGPAQARDHAGTFHSYLLSRLSRDGWDNAGGLANANHRMAIVTDMDTVSDLVAWRNENVSDPSVGAGAWTSCNSVWVGSPINMMLLGSRRHCLDVIAHEFVHAIDSDEGAVATSFCQASGSIEEGIGDVIGELTQRWSTGATDWVHGTGCEACVTARNTSLISPGSTSAVCLSRATTTDPVTTCGTADAEIATLNNIIRPQPDNFSNYRLECGSHFNSSIVSHVGYLMGREWAEGATTYHGVSVAGVGEQYASGIWYRALVEDLAGAVTFTDLRSALISECGDLGAGTLNVNCVSAVNAGGWFSADVYHGFNAPRGVEMVLHPETGFTTRGVAIYHNPTTGRLSFRTSVSPVSSTWSAEGSVHTTAIPAQRLSAAVNGLNELIVCYTNSSGSIWCDHRTDATWAVGPDPGGTGNAVGVSVAHFNGYTYITYSRSAGTSYAIYWRRNQDGTLVWSTEQDTGMRTRPPDSSRAFPGVLASGDEDWHVVGSNELWLVYNEAQALELQRESESPGLTVRHQTGLSYAMSALSSMRIWGPRWGQAPGTIALSFQSRRPFFAAAFLWPLAPCI